MQLDDHLSGAAYGPNMIAGLVPPQFRVGYWGLPATIDDAEAVYGLDIYDKMMNDPDIAGIVTGLKAGILEEGIELAPADDSADAQEICAFCKRCIDGLSWSDQPLTQTLWDMLEALTHGHRLAELTLATESVGRDRGRWVLESLAVKPRTSYAFVVDSANRWLGVTAVIPGKSAYVRQGPLEDLAGLGNFIPKEKLFVFSFLSRNRDVRGRSLLRAAYPAWKKDQIGHAEDVKFISQFAGGKTTVTLGPTAGGGQMADGTFEPDPKKYHLYVASQLTNGGVGVFDEGTEVNFHMPSSNGDAFDRYFERNLRSKARAIAMAVRAFVESKFGSKADSGHAADVVDTFVRVVRSVLAESIRMQVIRLLVEVNFGKGPARIWLPRVVMSSANSADFAANATATAALYDSGLVTDAMRRQIAEDKLGLHWQDDADTAVSE